MKRSDHLLSIEELRRLHASWEAEIRKRLDTFTAITGDQVFYELIYCILTPQTSALNADQVVRTLQQRNFLFEELDPEPILADRSHYIRFHRTKGKRLLGIKEIYQEICQQLDDISDSRLMREWLVRNTQGLGWKESSHFLRNIGHRNLAILDRHILRNLVRARVITRQPATLTAREYLRIEKKFLTFSDAIGIPMDELDLLFWAMETGTVFK